MSGIKAQVTDKVDEVRERAPIVDHLIKMQGHYGKVQASQQAGAVTYFAFLSFFPILGLAFTVVGIVANVYPQAERDLTTGLEKAFPSIIGGDSGLQVSDIAANAGATGIVSALVLLYSGLNWLSALRLALIGVFELPEREKPNFVVGKLRDLMTLGIIGLVLVVSVAISGVVTKLSGDLLELVDLEVLSPLLVVLAVLLGLAANVVLFFSIFKLLTDTETPRRSLLQGALLGAIGFEVLKQLSTFLIASTKGQPAFQAFGIALILVVWINYFTRLILYAASFAYTTPEAIEARGLPEGDPVQGPQLPDLGSITTTSGRPAWLGPFAAGGAAMLGLLAFVRSRVGS